MAETAVDDMPSMGPCEFSELPERYRVAFEKGRIDKKVARFFPCQVPTNAISSALFFAAIYLIPAIYLTVAGTVALMQKRELVSRMISDMTSGWLMLLVGLLIAATVVWGLYLMLKTGLHACYRAQAWKQIKQTLSTADSHYGLILDENNLVFRHGEYFDESTCGWLTKAAIRSCRVKQIKVWFPKRSYFIDVVSVQYVDDQQQHELILKERFGMTAVTMCQQLEKWL